MRVYRLCKESYSVSVLAGDGGRIAAGRWHGRGRRVVYCASSEALAVLELRVHLGRYIPRDRYVMHEIDVPDECIAELASQTLPSNWDAVPHTPASQVVGDEWLVSGRTVARRVPSVHTASDKNYLLNPEHPDIDKVRVAARRPYGFDHRLFESPEK